MNSLKLLFAKSKWDLPDLGLADFLAKIKAAGFGASELYLPTVTETDGEVRSAHEKAGLKLVAQIVTEGDSRDAHEESLRRLYARSLACGAVRVICLIGRWCMRRTILRGNPRLWMPSWIGHGTFMPVSAVHKRLRWRTRARRSSPHN